MWSFPLRGCRYLGVEGVFLVVSSERTDTPPLSVRAAQTNGSLISWRLPPHGLERPMTRHFLHIRYAE
jgi:hypothetical protein